MRKFLAAAGTVLVSVALSVMPGLTPILTANAAPALNDFQPRTVWTTSVSASCVAQINAIAESTGADAAEGMPLCTVKTVITESSPTIVTTSQAKTIAASQDLSAAATTELVQAAAAGTVRARYWTHAYWGGTLYEVHTGTTYYNGAVAWIYPYAGYAGSHTCHAEGSLSYGWGLKQISCNRPAAGPWADAVDRFDASIGWNGSPITMSVGLHHSTNKYGSSVTWQVGG